ncbi:excalibur calcium-binding domain-containing protein [Mycolicibacterium sp. CBM1]
MNRVAAFLVVSALSAMAIGIAAPANAEPAVPFKNCTAAKAAGYCDITSDSPLYTPSQDRDSDGYACEC